MTNFVQKARHGRLAALGRLHKNGTLPAFMLTESARIHSLIDDNKVIFLSRRAGGARC